MPTRRNCLALSTTGTLRNSLANSTGNTSESRWFGVRQTGGGRITSEAITLLNS